MKTTILFTLILLSFLLSSCISRLLVTVDIFDHKAYKESYEYKLNEIADFKSKLEDIIHRNGFDTSKLSEKLISGFKTQNKFTPAVFNSVQNYIHSTLKNENADFLNQIEKALVVLVENPINNYSKAFLLYSTEITKLNKLSGDLILYFKLNTIQDSDLISSINLAFNNSIHEVDFSFGESITGDPLASLVINAPDNYWKKYKNTVNIKVDNDGQTKKRLFIKSRSNVTSVCTFLGNSDIAVKMDSPGNFIVKGARVDADEALKASFKVLNQGIKYLAYSYGIPTAGTNTGTSNNNNVVKIPELINNQQYTQEKTQITSKSDIYTQAFMKIIISQLKNKNGIDTSIIMNSYKAYKSILPLESNIKQ